MKFTDDLIEMTGTIPTIQVRYARETFGQPVYIHGFNGLELERVLGKDSKISYVKSEIAHKPALFINSQAKIDDTPENRVRIALFCQERDFIVSREDWAMIDGDGLLAGSDATEAEIVQEVVVPKKRVKIQRKKVSVKSKNIDDSEETTTDTSE